MFRVSPIAGSAIRLAVAVALCLGAATRDALTASACWLSGLATGHAAAEQGYFHSHGPGELAHWHPWDPAPVAKPTNAAKPPSDGAPGYAPSGGGVHNHLVSPSIAGAVATFGFVRLVALNPIVESGRLDSCLEAGSTPWRVTRPRGPPVF